MEAPKGMIMFRDTPVSLQLKKKMLIPIYLWIITAIGALLVAFFVLDNFFKEWVLYLLSTIAFIPSLSALRRYLVLPQIPLAINLNHPFMEAGHVGKSELMVCFDGKWREPGINHLKLVEDGLGTWLIHRNDSDLSVMCTWNSKHSKEILQQQLSIVNQGISMNNVINDSNDEFDDARERETQDSDLLEREWLDHEQIEIAAPFERVFSGDGES